VFTVRGVLPVHVTDRGYFAEQGVTITTTHMGWEYTVDAHLKVELLDVVDHAIAIGFDYRECVRECEDALRMEPDADWEMWEGVEQAALRYVRAAQSRSRQVAGYHRCRQPNRRQEIA
jgi:hypothetical protein